MFAGITVTGATGFIGKHLVERIIAEGFDDVEIISRRGKAEGHYGDVKAIKVVKADLTQDSSIPSISNSKVLIHLAYSRDNFDENKRMASNIIKAAQKGNILRIIHCSTAVISGFSRGGIINESSSCCPSKGYQQNKSAIEQMFITKLPPQVELVILRPAVVVGPSGPGLDFIFNRILSKTFSSYIMYWFLRNRRTNFVAIDNVVEAIMLFVRKAKISPREIYLVSDDDDGDNIYGRVDQLIRKYLGWRMVWPDIGLPNWYLRLMFRFLPSHSPPDIVYLTDKLKKAGYERRVRLSETIHGYVENKLKSIN
jgi:nucleoside-diphosphate-sugar epimerase